MKEAQPRANSMPNEILSGDKSRRAGLPLSKCENVLFHIPSRVDKASKRPTLSMQRRIDMKMTAETVKSFMVKPQWHFVVHCEQNLNQ